MRRITLLIVFAGILGGCSSFDNQLAKLTHDSTPSSAPTTGYTLIGLMLATPPVNTILISSCKDELFMDDSRRSLCDLNHKIRGTTSPWERNAADARLMAYQPGELQCSRTLGGVSECRVLSGMPRPVTLIAPNMGAN